MSRAATGGDRDLVRDRSLGADDGTRVISTAQASRVGQEDAFERLVNERVRIVDDLLHGVLPIRARTSPL